MSPSASPITTRFTVAEDSKTTGILPKLFTARITLGEIVELLRENSGRAGIKDDDSSVTHDNETLTPITLLLGWVVDEYHEGMPMTFQKTFQRSCFSFDALSSHLCVLWLEITLEAPEVWNVSFPSPDSGNNGLLFYPEWIKWQNCMTLMFRHPGRLKEIGSLATSVPLSNSMVAPQCDSFRMYLWEGSETLLMTQAAAQQSATKLQRALIQAYSAAGEKRLFIKEALFGGRRSEVVLALEPIKLFSKLKCQDIDFHAPMSRACAHPIHRRNDSRPAYIHTGCRPALCEYVSLSRRLANENWLFYRLLCDWYHDEHCSPPAGASSADQLAAWSWLSISPRRQTFGASNDFLEDQLNSRELAARLAMSQSSPTKMMGNSIPVLVESESDRGHLRTAGVSERETLRMQQVQNSAEDETSASGWATLASEAPLDGQRIRLSESCDSASPPEARVTRSSTVGKSSVPPLSFAMIRNLHNVEENGRCGQSASRRQTSPLSSTRKNPDKSPHRFPSSRSNVSSEISSSHSTDRSSAGDVGCSSSISRGISLPNANPLASRGITTLKLPLANLKRSPNTRDRDLSSERNQPSSARNYYTHAADAQDRPALLAKYKSACSIVIPNRLFLGGETVAQDFQKLVANGITHILNTAGDTCPNYFQDKFSYLTYVLQDSRFTNETLEAVILHSVSFIEDAIKQGGAVFVHCKEGVSRSCTHVVAYLMWKFRLSFQTALDRVREVREVCNPNTGFTFTLLRLGKRLHRYSIDTPMRSELRKASSAVSTAKPPNSEQKLSRLTLHHPAAPFLVLQGSLPLDLFPASGTPSEPTPLLLDRRFYYVCRDDLLFFIWKGSQVPRRIEDLAQETINSYLKDIRFFEGIPPDHPDWEVIRLDERDEEYYCEPQEFWRLMAEIMMPTNSSLGLLCLNVNPVNRVNLVGTQKTLDGEAKCLAEEECVSQLFNFEAWQDQLRRGVGTPKSDRIHSGELRTCQRRRSFTFIPPKNTELVNTPC